VLNVERWAELCREHFVRALPAHRKRLQPGFGVKDRRGDLRRVHVQADETLRDRR